MANEEKRKVKITIEGPVSAGKSLVMDRIVNMLEEEYGATVVSTNHKTESHLRDLKDPAVWEMNMIRDSEWHVIEVTTQSNPT